MPEFRCTIERLANGYEVEVTDPAIVKANRNSDMKTPWRDPKVCYAFKTVQEVMKFLEKNLDKALPLDDYSSSFNAAVQETADE